MRRGGGPLSPPPPRRQRLSRPRHPSYPSSTGSLRLSRHRAVQSLRRRHPMLYIIHICSLFISGDDEAVASSGDKYASEDHANAEESAGAGGAEWSMLISGPGPRRREEMETEKDAFTLVVQKFKAAGKRWAAKMNEKVLTQVYGICKTIVPD